jgi:hypothetical protein
LIVIYIVIGFFLSVLLLEWFIKRKKDETSTNQPIINIDLDGVYKELEDLPNKVLRSIVSSTSFHKGALGELVGYLSLKAEYDRVIPLGGLVDCLLIKYPSATDPGKIVFCDIKTGKAKLTKDQLILKQLIKDKKVEFLKFSLDVKDVMTEDNSE